MQIADNGTDYVSAPSDYAELFRVYYLYVVNLVNRMGIEESRKEDVASEILTRFYERDFLAKFDPTLVFTYAGEQRPARFKSFLSKFVLAYVRGHYDRQQRLANREWLICDKTVTNRTHTGPESETPWLALNGPTIDSPEDDVLDLVVWEGLVAQLRAHLARVPRRSKYDNCDLVMLFDEVTLQVRVFGEINIADLTKIFRVSATAMHGWVWWLRENLADALNRPVPPKRRRTTKPKTP